MIFNSHLLIALRGKFTLFSGRESTSYIDDQVTTISHWVAPHVALIQLRSRWLYHHGNDSTTSCVYGPTRGSKSHARVRFVEGSAAAGHPVVLLEDVITIGALRDGG
jgi:orotate phosphoribosyltransferase